jgi:serine/threonine protein kinase
MEDLQPGVPGSVGSYRLLAKLGAGGMGQVFLGVSPGGRKVAVKLISPEHAGSAQFRERFAREIEAARRVGGFHTAPVVDADPEANPPWMVTAYIEGPSLEAAVARDGPLPPDQVYALGAGLAEGLAAIHACGLVHRDLKPANVIMAGDGPRIIDFGIARAADAATLTTAGTVIGTFAYMSPEQLHGDPVGPASDVFSLGCVLAFAATGRPPFGADSAAAVVLRITTEPPDLVGLADEQLSQLIGDCLAKRPEARPAVPALLAALASPSPVPVTSRDEGPAATDGDAQTQTRTHSAPGGISAADVSEPSPPIKIRPRRPPGLNMIVILVLLGIIGFGAYYLVPSGSGKPSAAATAHGTPHATALRPTAKLSPTPTGVRFVIRVTAVEECWTQLTTVSSGAQIYTGVIPAGSSMSWTEYQGVSLRLGNPGGVVLTVDGKRKNTGGPLPDTITINAPRS